LFGISLFLALLLRIWIALHFANFSNDGLGYEALARNLAQHGVFSLDGPPDLRPTDARMPGYPLILAGVYSLAGNTSRDAVRSIQAVADASLVLWLPWLAWELCPAAAMPALLAAVVEPFTAEFTASILTESLTLLLTTVALLLMVIGYKRPRLSVWCGCGAAVAGAVLFRPDSVLLLGSLLVLLVPTFLRSPGRATRLLLVFSAGFIILWGPWLLRNLVSLHRFQPLADFYAAQEGEVSPVGFLKWTRTWVGTDDYLESVSWRIDEAPIDPNSLPREAFDSDRERTEVSDLVRIYNQKGKMGDALDRRFGEIADQRIRRHPLKYFVLLPLQRSFTLWFSSHYLIFPLTEKLLSWRSLADDPRESIWINLFFLMKISVVSLGVIGVALVRDRKLALWAASAVIARTLVMSWLPYPEYRYVLEVFPLTLVMASVGLALSMNRRSA
jgi:hypothetical protein